MRAPTADLSLPMNARKKTTGLGSSTADQTAALEQISLNYSPKSSLNPLASQTPAADSGDQNASKKHDNAPPGGSLSIMLKKGTKVQLKDLQVPVTEEMAENIRQQNLVSSLRQQNIFSPSDMKYIYFISDGEKNKRKREKKTRKRNRWREREEIYSYLRSTVNFV